MTSLALTLFAGSRVITTAGLMGTDLIIAGITKSTTSIISGIQYLTSTNQQYVNEILNDIKNTDLVFTVEIIEQFVKEQENKDVSASVKKALIGMNDILEEINAELKKIKEMVETHDRKMFSGWRSFDCDKNIDQIKKLSEVLNHRYNILIDLLKIPNQN